MECMLNHPSYVLGTRFTALLCSTGCHSPHCNFRLMLFLLPHMHSKYLQLLPVTSQCIGMGISPSLPLYLSPFLSLSLILILPLPPSLPPSLSISLSLSLSLSHSPSLPFLPLSLPLSYSLTLPPPLSLSLTHTHCLCVREMVTDSIM